MEQCGASELCDTNADGGGWGREREASRELFFQRREDIYPGSSRKFAGSFGETNWPESKG